MQGSRRPLEEAVSSEVVLVVVDETQTSTQVLPAWGEVMIGRDPECRIVIHDPAVSANHARLCLSPEQLTIEDLGSHNGTLVRDRPLPAHQPTPLHAGETIEIGSTLLIVKRRPFGTPRRAPREPGAGDPAAVIGASSAMDAMRRLARRIAPSEISVLILGETGVGKDVVAAMIHRMSARADKPLVRLNCAALSETLLASELFGHERGAFTGAFATKQGLLEMGEGGTVFLDEIGELPVLLQSKLLHVLEQHEVLRVGALHARAIDVRFIAATNRDLDAEVEAGTFRRDLYYRLNAACVKIPPLRERVDEILPLAHTFLAGAAPRMHGAAPRLTADASARLLRHDWPGNIRELRNVISRALLLSPDDVIHGEHLGLPEPGARAPLRPVRGTREVPMNLVDPGAPLVAERQRILDALNACAGNQTQAAQRLGISRRTLINRILEYGLPRPRRGSRTQDG